MLRFSLLSHENELRSFEDRIDARKKQHKKGVTAHQIIFFSARIVVGDPDEGVGFYVKLDEVLAIRRHCPHCEIAVVT